MSGTDPAYAAVCRRIHHAKRGTDLAYAASCLPMCKAICGSDLAAYAYAATRRGSSLNLSSRFLPGPRSDTLSAYARATRCPVLRYTRGLPAYGLATRCPDFGSALLVALADFSCPVSVLYDVRTWPSDQRAAMISGTDRAYGPTR
eukprot:2685361-Rhodomonas_salina.3